VLSAALADISLRLSFTPNARIADTVEAEAAQKKSHDR
jgi:hypothetical protein